MGSVRTVAWAGALVLLVAAAEHRASAAGTIHMVTVGSDSVSAPAPGSLRKVLTEVQPGDTIKFAQNFSIVLDRKDPNATLKLAQSGVTIEGPAELRSGLIVLLGDSTTVTNMRFADFRVFAGTSLAVDPDARTAGFVFSGNTCVGDSGLQLTLMRDAVVENNTFDVRAFRFGTYPAQPNTSDTAVGDYKSEGSRWAGNTWTDTSLGGFEEADCSEFVFEGNTVVEDAHFRPKSGVISGNQFKAMASVFHYDGADGGTLTVQGNTFGSLAADRPSLEVIGNTVTGEEIGKWKVAALSASSGSQIGDAGFLRVVGNTVTATQGWLAGASITAKEGATECLVSGNTVTGGKTYSVRVTAAKSAVVIGNTVKSGGKIAAIGVGGPVADGLVLEDNLVDGAPGAGIQIAGGTGAASVARNSVKNVGKFVGILVADYDTDGLVLEENTVETGLGAGIAIGKGTHAATLRKNTVKGFKIVALEVAGRPFVSEDGVYRDSGTGLKAGKKTVAAVRGGSITGNKGAGLYADAGSSVEVARVAFGGNGGAGIDLAPAKVTVNAKRKSANGNMPWPETLEYDASTGRAKGVAEPFARIDAYAVEEGARAGNPKNGEGAEWLGEVLAGADGRFQFPAAGRLSCPPSKKVAFTATRQGAGIDPVTSEFSLDVDCGGPSFLLLDQAPDGSPGDFGSETDDPVLGERYRTISDDGRFVVFTSRATNLVEGDTNDTIDVFLRDTVLGTTTRVNRTPEGGQVTYEFTNEPDAGSAPSISGDGRWICYTSRARASFGDGTWYYNDPGVILYDTETGTNTIVASPLALPGPLPSGRYSYYGGYYASVSGDGGTVVFSAVSGDYVPGDAGDDTDAFVWTRATGAYERVSIPTGGGDPTNGFSASVLNSPRLSHDGRFAVFASSQNLTAGTLPYGMRAWVRDRQAGTTEAACIDSTGAIRSGYDPWISDDGRFVVFWSYDPLVPADTDAVPSVYLRDRQAGTTTLVSAKTDGTPFYGDCLDPCISGDGRWISFRNFGNIQLVDRETGVMTEVSGSPTTYPNVGCRSPRISRTGQFLQYETAATNLVDLGGQAFVSHAYLRDLSVGAE